MTGITRMTRITGMIEINWMTGTTGMSRITGMTEMKQVTRMTGTTGMARAIGMTVVTGITKKTEMQQIKQGTIMQMQGAFVSQKQVVKQDSSLLM